VQAREGLAQFEGRPHPAIRALGLLPHDDAILFAVPDESPYRSFEDIEQSHAPIRIAMPPDDGYCHAGWACQAVLDEHGLTREVIEDRGGALLYRERPHRVPPLLLNGAVDAVMNEAIMLPDWRELAQRRPTRFLSVDQSVLDRLHDKYRMRSRSIPAGRFPGQDASIRTVDFSGWLMVTTESLPEDVAYTVTSVMVETRADLERQYSVNPVELSPLTYPIRPDHMPLTRGVPLHAGAERYYRERGLVT
jgi:TRAP transporter TAXI family solute receptor